jgi:HEAT repeat protein
MLAMLPKVRGDAHDRLLAILRARGTQRRALAKVRSRRAFVRGEGAFALGALRSSDGVDSLIALLDDRSPLVQRVAARALGQIGDARATEPLLALVNRDPSLNRDLVVALREIGPACAPDLRAAVFAAHVRHRGEDRTGPLAATVLGMIQDVGASATLAEAVRRGPLALRLAAARALGNLDSPLGLAPLNAALRSPSNQVRVAAATSLGRLGSDTAIPALLDAVRVGDSATARAAAAALVELGSSGLAALERSDAPHAIEALALTRLRNAS